MMKLMRFVNDKNIEKQNKSQRKIKRNIVLVTTIQDEKKHR